MHSKVKTGPRPKGRDSEPVIGGGSGESRSRAMGQLSDYKIRREGGQEEKHDD